MAENIVLIGFMGVGKGAIARELVRQTDLFALDTDDLIESMENRKIKKIFKEEGEEYFRKLEQKCANWLCKNVSSSIISTGGGFYKVENLEKIGTIILLDASFDWIYNRIVNAENAQKKLKKRPLFNSYDQAKALYDSRQKAYKKAAKTVIDVENSSPEEAVKTILKSL